MKLYRFFRSSAASCGRIAPSLTTVPVTITTAGRADIGLDPQAVDVDRYRLGTAPYPAIARVFADRTRLPAFAAAHPESQPNRDD